MLCALSNYADQTINPGESAVFTVFEVPCDTRYVRTRLGTGLIMLSGRGGCPCRQTVNYLVDFGADVAIPEGGTVVPITVSIAVNGSNIPSGTMTVTPAAAEDYFNISKAIVADVWRGCCETLTITNTSTQPITMRNASLLIDKPERNR